MKPKYKITHRVRRRGLALVALAMIVAGMGTGGCAGVPERAAGDVVGGGTRSAGSPAPASASGVFLPGSTAAALASVNARDLPEFARGDGRLGAVPPGPMLATAQWEQPEQPTIERPRYLTFTTSSTSAVFFLPKIRRYER
jgi:hypothetical protein